MTRTKLLWATLGVGLLFPSCAVAQDRGYWRAASRNASSITGDIALSNEQVSINLMAFPVVPVRALKPEEAVAAFDAGSAASGSGNLYRINIPGATKLLHKNTLCGGEDTLWMATYAVDKTLQIAFFSGANPPVLSIDALANSTDLCGTYAYRR